MGFIEVPPDSTGKLVDTSPVNSSSGGTAHRSNVVVSDPTSTGGLAPVTSSGGMSVAVTNPTTAVTVSNISTAVTITNPTTAVSLSSAPTVVAASSGVTQVLTSGPFLVVNTSSGLVQTLTSGPVLLSSAGLTQIFTSSANPLFVFTMSSGGTTVRSLSSGTVTLSSNPTVVSASSGLMQVFTMSSGGTTVRSLSSGTVTATAATNPWSSAPGFNMPVVSVSSGLVGTFPSTGWEFTVFQINASSSNSITTVATGPLTLYGWNVGNQTTGLPAAIKIYNSSSSPAIGSTTLLKVTIPIPGSTGGAGNNLMLGQGIPMSAGLSFTITNNFEATSTGSSHAAGDVVGQLYYI